MNVALNTIEKRPRRAYAGMTEDILAWLRDGGLKPGDQLPTEQQLRERYGISVTSVRKGIELLVGQGLVERRRGSGTYVTSKSTQVVEAPSVRDTMLVGWDWEYPGYHPYYSEMLRGIRVGLERQGWNVDDLKRNGGERDSGGRAYHIADGRDWLAAALANRRDIAGMVLSSVLADRLGTAVCRSTPTVVIGKVPGLRSVAYDLRHETARALAAVLECGAVNVALVTSHSRDFCLEAQARASWAIGDAKVVFYHGTENRSTSTIIGEGVLLARRLLEEQPEFDAVVVTDDWLAQGVLDVLTAETEKMNVPVVCLVAAESRLASSWPVMRLVADGFALGEAAAKLLHRSVQVPHDAPAEIVLSCRWEHDPGAVHPEIRRW